MAKKHEKPGISEMAKGISAIGESEAEINESSASWRRMTMNHQQRATSVCRQA